MSSHVNAPGRQKATQYRPHSSSSMRQVHHRRGSTMQSDPKYTGQYEPRSSRSAYQEQSSRPVERDIKLITNAYQVITTNPDHQVFEYNLFIEPSAECQGLPPKVMTRAFVSRSIRKLIMNTILPQLHHRSSPPRGQVLMDPNLEVLFSLYELNLKSTDLNSTIDEYKIENIPVPTDLLAHLQIDITIRYSRSFRLNTSGYTASLLSSIMHHQLLNDMLRYESVYYLPSNNTEDIMDRLDLISRHLMGICISGVRKINDNQTLVVINCSHSYITQAHRLIDLLASFVEGRPMVNIELLHDPQLPFPELQRVIQPKLSSINNNKQAFDEFCLILAGFKCCSHDLNGDCVNLRFNLTRLSADRLYFDDGKTTVYDYYKSIGINLNYPNLPCLQSRSTTHPYYPFELCTLMPGQKVPIFRLSSQAKAHLMLMNKPHPSLSWKNSINAKNQAAARSQDQFQAFGVKLSKSPAEAVGSTLNKPILQYRDKTLYPARDYWESDSFYNSVDLVENWCLVDTVGKDEASTTIFFKTFIETAARFGFHMGPPTRLAIPKVEIMEGNVTIKIIMDRCAQMVRRELKFIMFIIDANSTQLNRLIHLSFDDHPKLTAACIRSESILNFRQHRSIQRTLIHKLNSRLGGTNVTYSRATWERLSLECSDIMIIGLDVTHPDNELNGVSIVGCAYTYSKDLFQHKSLVWPQAARKEIIDKMDSLMERLLYDYQAENKNMLPHQIIVYRDGVSHEEFERVRVAEINKASQVLNKIARFSRSPKPNLSYIIAQKRHTMRFFKQLNEFTVQNPPGGTLIDQGIVQQEGREFYLYSTSHQATARPLHYHVLLNGLGLENLQKLTYYLCFNFGKCSMSLSMPSSLRYAHNAAYDARNRVIASKEFHENKFYATKFFC